MWFTWTGKAAQGVTLNGQGRSLRGAWGRVKSLSKEDFVPVGHTLGLFLRFYTQKLYPTSVSKGNSTAHQGDREVVQQRGGVRGKVNKGCARTCSRNERQRTGFPFKSSKLGINKHIREKYRSVGKCLVLMSQLSPVLCRQVGAHSLEQG